jgi:hypothetical protein
LAIFSPEKLIMIPLAKICLACGKSLKGRSDKKFCDDYCRNSYNNNKNAYSNHYTRNINNALKKNRRVLEGLLAREKMVKVQQEKLERSGFQFKYHTHTYTNKNGGVYHFCYEYGYLVLESGWYLLVKRKEK